MQQITKEVKEIAEARAKGQMTHQEACRGLETDPTAAYIIMFRALAEIHYKDKE